ncbi:protein AGENET DOMAIN (AGD)-CONTAINING P1 [Ricinus communis]|uniref:RNA binding protein, putative n=1 Tax=Ricinus communis TaxID=3988 RepID=B9S9B0_RICCO|nr:protein AGENET DOMAIN (AGD)-CONTAINING P1 [Ricinus communis]EEF39879.1 RNA binding protein, putative [Ricinus communis]|eukprot:XP_025013761.1 DUF724 domain-containing protein 2-like [Ricinus communis]
MLLEQNQVVEICKKEEGFLGSYYPATVLAAIGLTRYLVRYETRYNEAKTRLLTEVVKPEDIRPAPPTSTYTNYKVNDRVDAYINDSWWVGSIVRVVDPNYYLKLECNENEVHCGFYNARIHFDWEDDKWVYNANRPQQHTVDQSNMVSRPEDDGNQPNDGKQGRP